MEKNPNCPSVNQLTQYLTWPDTRLPQSRAGGQGPYLRSLDHLGRSSEDKDRKNLKKIMTDGPTKRGVESRSTQLKSVKRSVKLV